MEMVKHSKGVYRVRVPGKYAFGQVILMSDGAWEAQIRHSNTGALLAFAGMGFRTRRDAVEECEQQLEFGYNDL